MKKQARSLAEPSYENNDCRRRSGFAPRAATDTRRRRNWFELFLPPEAREVIQRDVFLRSIHAGEIPISFQNEIVTRAGARRLIAWTNTVLWEADGKVSGVASIGEDITDRRKAEASLRDVSQLLEQTLASLSDAVLVIEAGTRTILSCNPATEKIFGYTRAELLGRNTAMLHVNQHHYEDYGRRFAAALGQDGRFETEFEMKRKEGTVFPIQNTMTKIPDETGKPAAFVSMVRDITGRKMAETALRESHEKIIKLTNLVPGVVYQYRLHPDGSSCFPFASLGMNEIYELTPEALREDATPVFGYLHPEDLSRIVEDIQKSAHTLAPFHCEFRVLLPRQGLRWRLSDALPERTVDGGTLWHGVISDITERKLAEEALRTSLREKEALLKEVHHRVKNNLQVVTSLLRLEAGRTVVSDTQTVLGDMQGRIQAMALLHESLYRSGIYAAVDLGAYLGRITAHLFRTMAVNQASIRLQLNLASIRVEMDQAMPCGLLANELVSNCLKHGFPAGRTGEILVELQPVDNGPGLRLRVSDNGVGLPPDFAARRERTLGLKLASDLAHQLDSTLEVGPGPDSVFTVSFMPGRSHEQKKEMVS